MRLRFLPVIVIAAAATVPLASQTIRLATPVASDARAQDVLILREFDATTPAGYGTLSAAHGLEAQRRLRDVADMALVDAADAGAPLALRGWRPLEAGLRITEVTIDAPRILGLQLSGGRAFTPEDLVAPGRVGILTHAAWTQYFDGSLSVLGSRGTLGHPGDLTSITIVGVLAANAPAATPEIAPSTGVLILSRAEFAGGNAGERWYSPVVRLRPGVSAGEAQQRLDETAAALRRLEPGADIRFRLESLRPR